MTIEYQFKCNDCSKEEGTKFENNQLAWRDEEGTTHNGYHPKTGEYLFYVVTPIGEAPSSPKCPKCGGNHTCRSWTDASFQWWVRGNGLVNDKAGARRDMNRFKLVHEDPYANMRVSGEVDHMLAQMRDRGRDMEKVRKERAAMSREAKRQADLMEEYELSEDQLAIIKRMDEMGGSCLYDDLGDIHDLNGQLSKLIPEYVCKVSEKKFMLMALGRQLGEELTLSEQD